MIEDLYRSRTPGSARLYAEACRVLPAAVGLQLEFDEDSPVVWPLLATGVRVDELAARAGAGGDSFRDTLRRIREDNGERRER